MPNTVTLKKKITQMLRGVTDAKELSELLNSNIDTTRVVQNARKLLARHTSIIDEWKKLALDN